MCSQLPSSGLIKVVLASAVLAAVGNAKILNCYSHMGNLAVASQCHCKEVDVDETPWPSSNHSKTAPNPKSVSLHFNKSNTGQIYPNIRWTVKAQFLEYIDGFHMEVAVWPNSHYYYICNYNVTESLKGVMIQEFEFEGCCLPLIKGTGFKARDNITVRLQSLPLYNIKDHSYYADASAVVPSYSGKKKTGKARKRGKKRRGRRRKGDKEKIKTIEEPIDDSNSRNEYHLPYPSYVMIAVVTTLCTLCVIAIFTSCAYFIYRRRRSVRKPTTKRHILLIGDCGDESCIKLYNGLIETLKKCSTGDVEIVANIRNVSDIATTGIISWATENIRHADAILFVVYSTAQVKALKDTEEQRQHLQHKNSHVRIALGVAESETVTSNFRQSKRKFVVLHTTKDSYERNNLLSFCTQYLLSKDFKQTLKHVLGDSYNRLFDTREDYDYLVKQVQSIALSRDSSTCKPPGAIRKTVTVNSPANNLDCSLVADPSSLTARNSLDQSLLYRTETNSDSGCSSMECNAVM